MTWVSSGSAVKIQDPGTGTPELVIGYYDRDVNLPDRTNDIKTGPSFGAGNRNVYNVLGKATMNGSLSFTISSGRFFYYLLANNDDSDSYSVSGAGPYTHVITPTKAPTLNPFDLLASLDGFGSDPDFLRTWTGCQFYSGTISCSVDEPLRVETEFGATGITSSTAVTTATTATDDPFQFYMMKADVTVMGVTVTKLESFEISYNNQTKQKWYFNATDSRDPSQLIRGYRDLSFSGNLVVDHYLTSNNNSVYHLLDTGTPADITVTFERATNDEIKFELLNCLVESAPHNLSEAGDEVTVPVTITPEQVRITVVDDTTTYVV